MALGTSYKNIINALYLQFTTYHNIWQKSIKKIYIYILEQCTSEIKVTTFKFTKRKDRF